MPSESRLLRGLFGFGDGGEEAEESFDSGDFQSVVDTLIYGDEGKAATVFLAGHVGSYHGADAGGIGQGDVGEIQNEGARGIGAELGLKTKDVGQGQGSGEVPDLNSFARSGALFDSQGRFRHVENGNGERRAEC